MNNREKVLSTLGLAYRASGIVSGEEMVLEMIRKGGAKLVFLAADAGESTTKRITDKSTFYKVSLNRSFTGEELSHAIGKSNRKVLAVTDSKLAALLEKTANE